MTAQVCLSSSFLLSDCFFIQQTPLLRLRVVAGKLWQLQYLVSLRAPIHPHRPWISPSIASLNIVVYHPCFARLCVLAGASCWVLYVDVLVLEMGGEEAKNVGFSACTSVLHKINFSQKKLASTNVGLNLMLDMLPPSSSSWGWGLRSGKKYIVVSFLGKLTLILSFISIAALSAGQLSCFAHT